MKLRYAIIEIRPEQSRLPGYPTLNVRMDVEGPGGIERLGLSEYFCLEDNFESRFNLMWEFAEQKLKEAVAEKRSVPQDEDK